MLQNLKRILARGIALAIPLGAIIFILIKVERFFENLIKPVAQKMGADKLLGQLTLTFFAILLIILLVFLLGLLMRVSFIAGWRKYIDSLMVRLFPSLAQFQTIAAEQLNMENELSAWKAVILLHQEQYYPAFLIEELGDLITFFLFKGISAQNGEVLITDKKSVRYFPISTSDIMASSKTYGKGYLELIHAHEHQEEKHSATAHE